MAYTKRAAEDTIAQVSKMFPVLLVTGQGRWEKRLFCKDWLKYSEKRGMSENM